MRKVHFAAGIAGFLALLWLAIQSVPFTMPLADMEKTFGVLGDPAPSGLGLFGPPEFDWMPKLGSFQGLVRSALEITWRHGVFVGFTASSLIHLTLATLGGRNRCNDREP